MKTIRNITTVLLVAVMMICMGSMSAFATSETQDGLEVTLTTDKTTYSQSDKITTTISVKNTNDVAVNNVVIAGIKPSGYSLADNSSDTKKVDSLAKDKTESLTVSYVADSSGGEGKIIVVDTGNGIANRILAVVGLIGSLGAIIFALKTKKGKRVLSLILSVSLLGTVAICSPVNVNAVESKAVVIKTGITVEGKALDIKAEVRYDALNNEENNSEYETIELITKKTKELTAEYRDENGMLPDDEEIIVATSKKVYEYAQQLENEDIIKGSAYTEFSNTVSFFLKNGTTHIYVPMVEGQLSGKDNYRSVSIRNTFS